MLIASRLPGKRGPVAIPASPLGGLPILVRPGTTDLTNASDYLELSLFLPPPEAVDGGMSVIVELGSNMGAGLTGLAHRFPDATLVGVEPDPGNAALAARNVSQFGSRAKVVCSAIWDRKADLVVQEAKGEHGFIVRERNDDDPADIEVIPALSIGQVLDAELGPETIVDYMHVTIEGTEPRAFASGDWAERVRSLRVEAHPYYGYPAADCVAQLQNLGFRAWPAPEMPEKWIYAVREPAASDQSSA